MKYVLVFIGGGITVVVGAFVALWVDYLRNGSWLG